jgi:hypothetical protein
MALKKCPRCELNYIFDDGELCSVCRREVKGEKEKEIVPDICPECGENPVIKGEELCIVCLREKKRQENLEKLLDSEQPAQPIDIDDVSGIDETVIPIAEDIPPDELQEIDEELGIQEDETFEEEADEFVNEEEPDDDYDSDPEEE